MHAVGLTNKLLKYLRHGIATVCVLKTKMP